MARDYRKMKTKDLMKTLNQRAIHTPEYTEAQFELYRRKNNSSKLFSIVALIISAFSIVLSIIK